MNDEYGDSAVSARPLLSALGDRHAETSALFYREPLTTGDEVAPGVYLPSTKDLLGTPQSSAEPQRRLMSIWSLINYEVDTWRTPPGEQDHARSADVESWLQEMGTADTTSGTLRRAFDTDGAVGTAIRQSTTTPLSATP